MTKNKKRMDLYAGVRGRRRLLSRRLRLPRGRRHLRHDVGDREVLERRDDELRAERVHAVRGLPSGVQRREGTARRAVVRAPAVGGLPTATRSTSPRASASGPQVPMPKMTRRARRRRQSHARSDLPKDRRARVHAAPRFARRRDVVPHRHRDPEQHRPEDDRSRLRTSSKL